MHNVGRPNLSILKKPSGPIRICLIVCGYFDAFFGSYVDIYKRWLQASLPPHSNVQFQLDAFDAMSEKYPTRQQMDQYNAVIISASAANAASYDTWITHLILFIQETISERPNVRLYGNAFGHQLISRAIGGTVRTNDDGLEIGLTPIQTTYMGKLLFGVETFNLIQFHRDVVDLNSLGDFFNPGALYLIGKSERTYNQGIVKFYPYLKGRGDLDDELVQRLHVFTTQGNPEFLDEDLHKAAKFFQLEGKIQSYKGSNDGVSVIGKTFWRMLGVEYPKDGCPARVPV